LYFQGKGEMKLMAKVFMYKMGLNVCVDLSTVAAVNLQGTERRIWNSGWVIV